MRAALWFLVASAALAACNKGPQVDEKNASVAEVAQKVRAATAGQSLVEPGKWETKVSVLDVDIPGMPAQMAAQMKRTMGTMQEHSFTSCLTEEDVRRPKEDFFAGNNKSCRYEHFDMEGGKIDALMKCASEGSSNEMTLVGNYTPDTYNMRMTMNAKSASRADGMTMKMRVDAKRVGECKGDET